jgi:biopolymer transport protein ExbD
MTPMIDVVFLLVIFFLVASYLSQTESTEPLELAVARSGDLEDRSAPRRIVVTIARDGRAHAAGRPLDPDAFDRLLSGESHRPAADRVEVRLRADRRVPYGLVEPFLAACARAGVTRLKFNVLPE